MFSWRETWEIIPIVMWGVYIYIYIYRQWDVFFNDIYIYNHVEENGLYIYMDMRMGKLVSGLGSHRNKRIM